MKLLPPICWKRTTLLALAPLLSFSPFLRAAESNSVQGATVVLQRLTETTTTTTSEKPDKDGATAKLAKDIEAFQASAPSLSAEQATTQWLELVDRYFGVSGRRQTAEDMTDYMLLRTGRTAGFGRMVAALPPPQTWETLTKKIEARKKAEGRLALRQVGLQLLGHTLVANTTAQQGDVTELEKVIGQLNQMEAMQVKYALGTLSHAMIEVYPEPTSMINAFERQLSQLGKKGATPGSLGESDFENDEASSMIMGGILQVPDLVTLAGKEKAEALLRRALVLPVAVTVNVGDDTRALARKLALELVEKLAKPQWSLCESLDAIGLYEAMDKRFGKAAPVPEETTSESSKPSQAIVDALRRTKAQIPDEWRGGEREQARLYYLLGLIAASRSDDAVKVANQISKERSPGVSSETGFPPEALDALDRVGRTQEVHAFLHRWLGEHPDARLWEEYIKLSARVGKTDEMLTLVRSAAARPELTAERRIMLGRHLVQALLAADQVEEGVKELKKVIAETRKKSESEKKNENTDTATEEMPFNMYVSAAGDSLGSQLFKIGRLVKRSDWQEEGLRALREAFESTANNRRNSYSQLDALQVSQALETLGRYREAEAVLTEALTRQIRTDKATAGQSWHGFNATQSGQLLCTLAGLYSRVDRQQDVLLLLDQARWWGVKDLKFLRSNSCGPDKSPIGYVAAKALAEAGRNAEARTALDSFMDQTGGFDPSYALLLKLGDKDVMARLDELFRRDQFEERPLIWKADMLRQQGKLDDAERVIRQAIRIDPSDGEQPHGDRMRAYAVLADILEARGNSKEATTYREAVKTIRLSEQADEFFEAGLLKRAVAMYEDALTHFADAYCVQSRAALRLSQLGQHEEAEKHYIRAFELMPDSFGRMESHCFGCEGIFSGARAQNAAEKVFTKLVAKQPDKPQVHYLLGYLRMEQGRFQDALTEYRKAVALDPDYINAWNKIKETAARVQMTAADRDACSLQLLRLDPLGRHAYADFSDVGDLRKLWEAVEVAQKLQPPTRAVVYPLAASATELAEADQKLTPAMRSQRNMYQSSMDEAGNYGMRGRGKPGELIAQHKIPQAIGQLLDATVQQY